MIPNYHDYCCWPNKLDEVFKVMSEGTNFLLDLSCQASEDYVQLSEVSILQKILSKDYTLIAKILLFIKPCSRSLG